MAVGPTSTVRLPARVFVRTRPPAGNGEVVRLGADADDFGAQPVADNDDVEGEEE